MGWRATGGTPQGAVISQLLANLYLHPLKIKLMTKLGLADEFIEHGDPVKLMALQGLDAAGIQFSIEKRFVVPVDIGRPALKAVA